MKKVIVSEGLQGKVVIEGDTVIIPKHLKDVVSIVEKDDVVYVKEVLYD